MPGQQAGGQRDIGKLNNQPGTVQSGVAGAFAANAGALPVPERPVRLPPYEAAIATTTPAAPDASGAAPDQACSRKAPPLPHRTASPPTTLNVTSSPAHQPAAA